VADGLEIMFDGMSLQHVGELLLDEPQSTRALRRLCFESYYASLKDFAFAAIFGSKIITSAPLPEVQGGNPGEALLTHFSAKHSRRPPPTASAHSPTWESLLDNEEDFQILKGLVASLDRLGSGGLGHWKDEVTRDIFLYLGDDKSLTKPKGGPDYRFEGRGDFRRYEGLQVRVPQNYRRQALLRVRQNAKQLPGVSAAHDDAIDEFICRNAVAHIGIYHWYCRVGEKSLDRQKGLRIPHATRQALPAVERSLWTVKEVTTPGLLEAMIAESKDRGELAEKIFKASQDTVYDALREKIAAAWRLSRWDYTREMDRINADIEREIHAAKNLQMGQVLIASGREEALYKEAVQTLAVRSTRLNVDPAAFRRVFKELANDR
jgi:hypothetical protein